MKIASIKFFDKILVILLGFFGIFNSCTQPDEYGTPYADFEIKGVVTSKETGQPIQNIRVIRNPFGSDTLYTDVDGKYYFQCGGSSIYGGQTFHLKVEDIDGEANGGDFVPQEIEVVITEDDRIKKGDGKWYEGKFGKTVGIELERFYTPEYGVAPAAFKP
jgi:putative lipoprotein (rSAM/lipoprotein system)